jgi:hypothetical protein
MATSMRAAALAYLARDWSIIPIEPRGKRPVVPWLEYQRRRAAPAEVEGWFERWPDANVGIVTGALSGLVVLDVDVRHGGDDSLAGLERTQGRLAPTVEARTGGGGRHLYFAHPGGTVPNRVALVPGIDLRGDGGCVVAPPSLHASGRRYAWVKGRAPGETALAALPPWILAPPGREEREARGHTLTHWRALVHQGVDAGARNATLASLAGHLLWHQVDPDVVAELLHAWNRVRCRPPLADEEVLRCVQSIVQTHARGHAAP